MDRSNRSKSGRASAGTRASASSSSSSRGGRGGKAASSARGGQGAGSSRGRKTAKRGGTTASTNARARKRTAAKGSGARGSTSGGARGAARGSTRGSTARAGTSSRAKTSRANAKGSAKSRGSGASKRATGATSRRPRANTPTERAFAALMEDHQKVKRLFKQGERARDDTARLEEIVNQACAMLTEHAEIEERFLYPVLRDALPDPDPIAEANVEHASAKVLIRELQSMGPNDERYAATFKVLGEYVNHHVEEEEGEIFPKARRAKVDLDALAEALEARDAGRPGQGDRAARGMPAGSRGPMGG